LRKLLFLFLAMFLLTACRDKSMSKDKIFVTTTFFPMYDFTKNIVGKEGQVSMLTPAGIEPHDFEPSAKDLTKIIKNQIFVYNSGYLETWVKKTLKNIDPKKTEIIEAAKGIKLAKLPRHMEDEASTFDPHVWLAPKLAEKEVINIRDGLIKKFPSKKKIFMKNAANYLIKLEKIADKYQKAFGNAKQRKFVTQHAAFSYLAKEYNLHQETVTGLSPLAEPTSKRLAKLKKYVQDNNLKTIYFEETATSKVARTLAKEAGVNTKVLNPLEGLTRKQQKAGKDYLSIMEDNLRALQSTIK